MRKHDKRIKGGVKKLNKKEAATLAYNLICGLADIKDSEFVDNIISAVQDGAKYDIEDMLIELEAGEYD